MPFSEKPARFYDLVDRNLLQFMFPGLFLFMFGFVVTSFLPPWKTVIFVNSFVFIPSLVSFDFKNFREILHRCTLGLLEIARLRSCATCF